MNHQNMQTLVPIGLGFLTLVSHGVVTTIDQGEAGYSQTGAWTNQATGAQGLNGNWRYQDVATATGDSATYDFSGLPAGNYVVSTPSFNQGNLSTDAQWALSDGAGTHAVNQRVRTTDFDNNAGTTFQRFNTSVGGGLTPISITDGTFQGILTDNDSAANSFLIADALRLERLRPDVLKIYTINNGGVGYSETGGTWATWAGDAGDYGTDLRFSNANPAQVTVTFSNVDPGLYRISAAWTSGANRPSAVTLGYSTTGSAGNSPVYSQIPGAAADDVFEEVNWQDMFTDVPVTDGELTLTLDKAGAGALIADGFRLEMTDAIPEPSSVMLVALAGLGFVRRRR